MPEPDPHLLLPVTHCAVIRITSVLTDGQGIAGIAEAEAIIQDAGGDPDDAIDRALARRARVDRAAFGSLYDRHVTNIHAYCYRRLGTREAAEDATALIFTRALSAIHTYRDDGATFRSWLFTIAHNTVIDELRTRRWQGGSLSTVDWQPVTSEPDPASAVIAADDLARLRTLLATLPPERARVVELRLAGLTDQEIASVTGRSHGAVRVTIHRALTQLRRLLHPTEDPHA